jgi:AraC-like DNA-binding protein
MIPAASDSARVSSIVSPPIESSLYKSVLCVRALLGGVARYGFEPNQVLVNSSLDPGLLADGRTRIPLRDWQLLVLRAMALTQDKGLGLALGGDLPEHVFQIVGQLAVSCRTLRDAMGAFQRYRVLAGNTCHFDLIEEGELAYFNCSPLVPFPEAPQFEAEMVLGLVYRTARRFATLESDDAQEIWMSHSAPPHAARYAEVFRCPVRFDRPRNAILFQRRFLDRKQPYADARTNELLTESAERLLAEQVAPSLPDRVRALLRYETNLCQVDARHMARMLRLHPRTFKRRLIQAQAPWSALLDETRRQVACDELCRSGTSLRAVAERLGFSDQSAFNRAFKRWTGQTPAQYSRKFAASGHSRVSAS